MSFFEGLVPRWLQFEMKIHQFTHQFGADRWFGGPENFDFFSCFSLEHTRTIFIAVVSGRFREGKHMKHRKGRKRRGQATANMLWMDDFCLGSLEVQVYSNLKLVSKFGMLQLDPIGLSIWQTRIFSWLLLLNGDSLPTRFEAFHLPRLSLSGVLSNQPRHKKKILRHARQTAEILQSTDLDDVEELRCPRCEIKPGESNPLLSLWRMA